MDGRKKKEDNRQAWESLMRGSMVHKSSQIPVLPASYHKGNKGRV